MKITIVSDKEPNLGKAAAVAASLKGRGLVQLYDFSTTEPGLVLTLLPAGADYVRETGGWDHYLAEVTAGFNSLGFKRFEAPVVKGVTIVPDTELDIAKAATIGTSLVRRGLAVESVRNPSKEISALDVLLLPPDAERVRIAGDWDLYYHEVTGVFENAGFKVTEHKPEPIKAAVLPPPPPEPFIAPVPLKPVVVDHDEKNE